MAKVVLRQEAIDDLNSIWDYTFKKWSDSQADKYYATIQLACKELSENLKLGKKYDEINKSLLGYKVGKHIIFYQMLNKNEIDVVRILHERMDLKNKMNE